MRIAMLAPINRRIPPRPYGPEEQMISDLTEGLVERGHEIVLFAAANSLTRAELVAACPRPLVEWEDEPWPDPRWYETLHVSECMAQAHRGMFDIVHNHMGAKALPLAYGINVPVLTNLYYAARNKETHHTLLRYCEYPYVAMDASEKALLPDLNYVAEVPLPPMNDAVAMGPVIDRYEEIYNKLVSAEIESPVSHIRRLPPWGSWEVLRDESDFKTKRIMILPGQRLSYQRHFKRREHWTVVRGEALVVLDDKEIKLRPGEYVDIPEKAAHRIGNPGDEPMVFIEVQMGSYFGEDDIERLDDDYGRS